MTVIVISLTLSEEYSILAFSVTKMDCGILKLFAVQILVFDFALCADGDCHSRRKENDYG